MSVPNLKPIAQIVQGSVMYVCAKFEADISIGSKLIRGSQTFEIWSRDPGHAHLGVVLWSKRSRGPSSMFLPNLKHIALFVQKLLGGSQNFEIGSRDPKPVPSYPMGPAGPGPGPPSLRGPQTADVLIFSSREISVTNCVLFTG